MNANEDESHASPEKSVSPSLFQESVSIGGRFGIRFNGYVSPRIRCQIVCEYVPILI
jgi:hypothetical protein